MTVSAVSQSPAQTPLRLPGKDEKNIFFNRMALVILRVLGDTLNNFSSFVKDEKSLDRNKNYSAHECEIFENGQHFKALFVYDLNSIFKCVNESRQTYNKMNVSRAEQKEISKLINIVKVFLQDQDFIEANGKARTGIPALLVAEQVKDLSESIYVKVVTAMILRNEKIKNPSFFEKTGSDCVIQ